MVHPNEQKYFVKQTQYIKQYGFIIKKNRQIVSNPAAYYLYLSPGWQLKDLP